ncbi:hypothetical protein ES705_09290 [subsurface metagenome]
MTGIIFTKPENGYSGALDYNELFSYAKGIPGVGPVWYSTDMPLYDKQAMADLISGQQLKRLVIAGDTPGMEKSFVH